VHSKGGIALSLQNNESVDLGYCPTATTTTTIWIIIMDDRVAVAVRACANLGTSQESS